MWADAVFEGGGVKGIGLVGALSVAEKKGYKWKNVAGTSAGSMIAALIAAGYTAKELHQLLLDLDFTSFLPKTFYHRIPYVGPALRMWIKKGIYSGDALEHWLECRLAEKGVRTFGDLQDVGLKIIASDITQKMLMILPDDLPSYGHEPTTFSVAKAVRMSCGIPFFFDPAMLYHAPSGKYSCIVDGGVLSNFPIWIFDSDCPRWPTFGFDLNNPTKETKESVAEVPGPLNMFLSLFYTMMDAHDNRYIRSKDQIRTISVPTLGVKITDFSLSKDKKDTLYQSGMKAGEAFFEGWTFDSYLQARGKSRSTQINFGKNDEPPVQKGS
ncbi:patatin-like phospholipase family protein [Thermoactinomyces sp. DSM 45892]|uniref:patatin-like phospholipase family protein n=1 Tax=Thermoactinomyces sp. DSM 45892 TaxID=1882753 RepID=UPI00089CD69C|nr:patatin-like phospholipase family protein [Thermoactinomyces sp. DSM 45892]SDY00698.1 NTE family protein [Thermoactinomyces sp. DSM 45892]